MIVRILVATAAVAALTAAPAAAATTPGAAARTTRACLRAHGWTATLADHGVTVNARAPRTLAGYPGRPWYSVAFYAGPRVGANELAMRLSRAELRTAHACRARGLR